MTEKSLKDLETRMGKVTFKETSRSANVQNKSTVTYKGLTKHQGPDRVFGHFKCPKCKKEWKSGNSWADMSQMCKRCSTKVYPYDQECLKMKEYDNEEEEEREPHPTYLCEKCKILGHSCRAFNPKPKPGRPTYWLNL